MTFVQNFPLFSIILSLFSGVLCSVLSAKAARNYILTVLGIICVMNGAVFLHVAGRGTYYIYWMGHFPAPWGNEIRIGMLESFLAFAFAVVMLLSLIGGMKHIFEDVEPTKINLYYLMISLLFSSMISLIYSNDLFTSYVFVEINTIAACAIVMLKDSGETLVSTMRYLVLSLLGSGMFLMGICILYDITGHLLMSTIHGKVYALSLSGEYALPLEMVIVLFCVGLATKCALFPFHAWLPDAHATATSASSAILSGLVLKGYIILLIKIIYRVIGFEIFRDSKAINVLFVMGLGGMLLGSAHALMEKDLKRMLAYSSIAQIGYIFLGIGLGDEAGMVAAIFQILAHAVTKPMLFCCAGSFMAVSGGEKTMDALRGAGRRSFLAGIAFVIGSLSMVGIPFLSGFVTKYYLAAAGIGGGAKMLPALVVLAVSTVMNAMYYIPAIIILFTFTRDRVCFLPAQESRSFAIATTAFIALNFLLGTASTPVLNIIRSGLSMLS